jgi:hypothetical protein
MRGPDSSPTRSIRATAAAAAVDAGSSFLLLDSSLGQREGAKPAGERERERTSKCNKHSTHVILYTLEYAHTRQLIFQQLISLISALRTGGIKS